MTNYSLSSPEAGINLKALYTPGEDHRMNLYEEDVPEHIQQQANSVACLVEKKHLKKNQGTYVFETVLTLKQQFKKGKKAPVASSVNFKDEIAPGFGTAFLVGKDLALTAGHCIFNKGTYTIAAEQIKKIKLIFGFQLQGPGQIASIDKSRVCKIKKIVSASQSVGEGDWALLKLNKSPEGVEPLPIDFTNLISGSTSIYMLGHPMGLPVKYTYNGLVPHTPSKLETHFEAAIDAFHGNSGSPIFDDSTHEVIGILTNGNDDYTEINGKTVEYHVDSQKSGYEKCQRMTILIEESIKNSFEPSLQECVQANSEMSDTELAELIKQNIPKNTYISIAVMTKPHSFLGEPAVPTRVLTFSPSGRAVDGFFLRLKKFLQGLIRKKVHTYKTDQIAGYLIGLPDCAKGETEVKEVFRERRDIYLFLSEDGKNFEARVDKNARDTCSIS